MVTQQPQAFPQHSVGVEIGNHTTKIHNLPHQLRDVIDSFTKYATDQAKAQEDDWKPPEAWLGEPVWDGFIHLSRFPAQGPVRVPTGLLDVVVHVLQNSGLHVGWQDKRVFPEPGVPSRGPIELRDYQRKAVECGLVEKRGVFDMVPRSGKTRTMFELQRCLSRNMLWTAPTSNIVKQTVRVGEEFFGKNYVVPLQGVSQVESVMDSPIVVCTAATAGMLPEKFWKTRDLLGVDEFHHAAATSYHAIAGKAEHIAYRYGMTGTFRRSGGDELALKAVLSNTIYKVTAQELTDRGFLVPADVVYFPVVGPRTKSYSGTTWYEGVGRHGIFEHEHRNNLAVWAAATLWSRGKKVLVLVGTKAQGRYISQQLQQWVPKIPGAKWDGVEFVSTDRKQNCQDIIDAFTEQRGVQVLVGTSMIGEGTDLPVADALVYAQGGKAEVSHIQATYRVCTAAGQKRRALIVDFADRHNPTLIEHSRERLETYFEQPIFKLQILDSPEQFPFWLDGILPGL